MRRLLPLLLLSACEPTADSPEPITRPFPEAFQWGSATAGFQVDMGCPTWSDEACIDTTSDWYAWVTDPRITEDPALYVRGEDVRDGPGMWELFEDDVAQMQADGHTAYRMSLEWSRLFPTDASAATSLEALDALADPAAVTRYREMFAALRAAGIAPLVTVNHYVLPGWVHDGVGCHLDLDACSPRGWVDGGVIIPQIALFAGWAGRTFGDDIDQWATLNEPFATALSGYLQPGEDRSAPPGLGFSGEAMVAVLRNQIEGHAAMYDALHAADAVDADDDGEALSVGIVLNLVDMFPADADSSGDVSATAHAEHLYHRLFLDGLTEGSWDDDLDGTFDRVRPELAGRLDWLGVNYYNRMDVAWLQGLRPLGDLVPAFDFLPTFSWEPHTDGLGAVVDYASSWDLPLYVTENGTPHTGQSDRILERHLASLHKAIERGADVRGYFYWSWVDNYEWNHGMDLRFGLYALDPDTKARTPRPVATRYAAIIAQGGLE